MSTSVANMTPVDGLAWQAVSEAPLRAVASVQCSPEYADLCRWFLWDKVGRSLRLAVTSDAAVFERHMLAELQTPEFSRKLPCWRALWEMLRKSSNMFWHNRASSAVPTPFRRSSRPLLYVPLLSLRLKRTLEELAVRKICQIVVQHNHGEMANVDLFSPEFINDPDPALAEAIHTGLIDGLRHFGVSLLERDVALLRVQLLELTGQVRAVHRELAVLQPDAVLVHGDNHPPFQAYVFATRALGIPSFMLQHGLDCEHLFLDEAYASHIAVWGRERERRYRQRSRMLPEIRVTGNPEFDDYRLPNKINSHGDYWLWMTRPHSSGKCYLPSRQPDEGMKIFAVLVAALQRHPNANLVIKPHPYDYTEHYYQEIQRHGLQNRVKIVSGGGADLIAGASIVISEDSTVGMEAMFQGKLLIHAHFCKLLPTMPFVDYGAALSGFSDVELAAALDHLVCRTTTDHEQMLRGQLAFLEEFAGPCDGLASSRVATFIESVLTS